MGHGGGESRTNRYEASRLRSEARERAHREREAKEARERMKQDLLHVYDEIGAEAFEKLALNCGLDLAAAGLVGTVMQNPVARASAYCAAIVSQNCRDVFLESLKRTYNTVAKEINERHRERPERERGERIRRLEGDNARLEAWEHFKSTG